MKKHDVADEVAFTAEHMLGKEAVELGIDVPESPLRVEEIDNTAYDEPSANQQERNQDTATARPVLVRSTTTSSAPVNVVKIPIGERSGLLSRLSLLYEAEEPKHYPRNIKWWITFEIALAAVAAPMGSSIILPALNDIASEFNTTPFIANLSVALYMLSMSIFPLWWSSFSETAGRRTVYIASFSLLVVWQILAALSRSITMFIIFRILSGGAAAAVQAVGAGTVADVWEVKERGRAMGFFYIGPLCGPLLSPVIGGALTEGLGWRSTQWFQLIYGALLLIMIVFFLPETHKTRVDIIAEAEAEVTDITPATSDKPPSRPHSLHRTVSQFSAAHTRKYMTVLRRLFLDPLKIILWLRFPAVAVTVYYASIAFGALYFVNISVEKTFSAPPYNFSVIIVGCLYIFNSTGYLLASLLGGRWVDAIMAREARRAGRVDAKGRLVYRPEDRMRENAWLGAALMPVALLWYGWTAERKVFWLAPMLANFFYGIGSMLIFAMATTMLTEFMPRKASNGVAINNFVRNIFSFGGTFLAEPLINAIGNGWLFTILGIITALSCLVIVAMRRYGDGWRKQMDLAMQ